MVQTRKRNNNWIMWVTMLFLFVLAGVACSFVWDAFFRPKGNIDSDNASEVVENVGMGFETEVMGSEVIEKEKVVQYDGNDPNEAEELSGTVTYAGVRGNALMIRVNIDQYLENGECSLSLVRDGSSIYDDKAKISSGPSTSTCEGFDVPTSEVGDGDVQIVITIDSGEKKGTIRGEIEL